jgi:hypothetical protein
MKLSFAVTGENCDWVVCSGISLIGLRTLECLMAGQEQMTAKMEAEMKIN